MTSLKLFIRTKPFLCETWQVSNAWNALYLSVQPDGWGTITRSLSFGISFLSSFWRYIGTVESRFLEPSISLIHKTPITRTKSRFPWICFFVILSPIFRTPTFSNQFSLSLQVREIGIPLYFWSMHLKALFTPLILLVTVFRTFKLLLHKINMGQGRRFSKRVSRK